MKLDDELKERLNAVADRVSVGDPEVRRFVRRGRRRSRTKVAGIAASVVVLLAGAGILGSYVTRIQEFQAAYPRCTAQAVKSAPRALSPTTVPNRLTGTSLRISRVSRDPRPRSLRPTNSPSERTRAQGSRRRHHSRRR